MSTDIKEALKALQTRVAKLEQAVFVDRKRQSATRERGEFTGATGGLRLLASKGFFDRKRTFGEITKAIGDHGYHYSKQAVQTPLNKLSRAGSMLVAFREGGKKVYAKRK